MHKCGLEFRRFLVHVYAYKTGFQLYDYISSNEALYTDIQLVTSSIAETGVNRLCVVVPVPAC